MRICAEKCTMTRQDRSKSTERDRGLRPERFMALVTFRQIRYFIAVAESGKISAAASMLGISPSVVTEAVSELETLSRMKLFQRQPRGLDLTYEGHRFLAHCRNILSAIEGANDALARPDSEMEGTLKLATTITVAGYFLAPLLSRFQKTFPNIQVQVVEEKRLEVEAGVIEGYTVRINPEAIGLPLAAILRIRPMPGELNRVADILTGIPEITACDRVTGDDCFIAKAQVPSVADLESLIDGLLPYASTNTCVVVSTLVTQRLPAPSK